MKINNENNKQGAQMPNDLKLSEPACVAQPMPCEAEATDVTRMGASLQRMVRRRAKAEDGSEWTDKCDVCKAPFGDSCARIKSFVLCFRCGDEAFTRLEAGESYDARKLNE